MPKDDDLKFDLSDLSDLFGGDLTDAKKQAEEAMESPAQANPVYLEREQELDLRLREMAAARERELEEKNRELEEKLRQLESAPSPEPPSAPEIPPTPEIPPAPPEQPESPAEPPIEPPVETPVESSAAPTQEAKSSVDFEAPIPRPFSGVEIPAFTADQLPSREVGMLEKLQRAEELRALQRNHEYFMLYDEYRNMMFLELAALVGDKKTKTMLSRTVEMARAKYPDVFKNANWDWEGNLVENGLLDSQRMLENKGLLPADRADRLFDEAFAFLLDLRLQAVEKGLGTGMKTKIRARMHQWMSQKIERARELSRDPRVLERLLALIPV